MLKIVVLLALSRAHFENLKEATSATALREALRENIDGAVDHGVDADGDGELEDDEDEDDE